MDAKNTPHPQLSYIRRLAEHRTRDVFHGAGVLSIRQRVTLLVGDGAASLAFLMGCNAEARTVTAAHWRGLHVATSVVEGVPVPALRDRLSAQDPELRSAVRCGPWLGRIE
jgi:hypothetical protein